MAADSLTTPAELAALLDSVNLGAASGASIYVELGVRRAGTSVRVKKRLERLGCRAHYIGIDCDQRARKFWDLRMGGAKLGSKLTCSFELSTTAKAAEAPRAGPLAWVFVDACHCLECVLADVQAWGAKLAPGGIMAVHDTRLRKYLKASQHGGTRRFGSFQAVERMEEDGGFLANPDFELLWRIDDLNGIRIYRKQGGPT